MTARYHITAAPDAPAAIEAEARGVCHLGMLDAGYLGTDRLMSCLRRSFEVVAAIVCNAC